MEEPLSPRTARRLAVHFPDQQSLVSELFAAWSSECSIKGPLRAATIERIQFGQLKVSEGSLERLRTAMKRDWRDVLIHAGFADDPKAHLAWLAELDRV